MSKVDEYKNKFPFGLEEFCKALSDDTRLAVISLLYEVEKPLNEKEITEQIKTYSVLIEEAIRKLNNYGIIRRVQSKWNKDKNIVESKYEINKIYRKLLDSCIDILKKVSKIGD